VARDGGDRGHGQREEIAEQAPEALAHGGVQVARDRARSGDQAGADLQATQTPVLASHAAATRLVLADVVGSKSSCLASSVQVQGNSRAEMLHAQPRAQPPRRRP
jgi:hypothetical protein